jgi:hypothetical protein
MPKFRIMAAATAVIAAFTLTPASARTCADGDPSCQNVQAKPQSAPLRLSQFITPGGAPAAKHRASPRAGANKHRIAAKTTSRRAVADALPNPQATIGSVSAEKVAPPAGIVETDGVAITSADEINEIDAAADAVQVVAANEVNEIDLAGQAAPATRPDSPLTVAATTSMTATAPADQAPTDTSWIGRIFLALGAILAVASATRLLIA